MARFQDYREMTARRDGPACNGRHAVKAGELIGWHRQAGAMCGACWARWCNENAEADRLERWHRNAEPEPEPFGGGW